MSYDLEVAAGKYFHSLRNGVVPLSLVFSGTVFRSTLAGPRVEPVPWHLQASYRLPVEVWGQLMDAYFPGEAWMRLRRGTVDAVARYKTTKAIASWDDAILTLLATAEVTAPGSAEQVIADRADRAPGGAGLRGARPAAREAARSAGGPPAADRGTVRS